MWFVVDHNKERKGGLRTFPHFLLGYLCLSYMVPQSHSLGQRGKTSLGFLSVLRSQLLGLD